MGRKIKLKTVVRSFTKYRSILYRFVHCQFQRTIFNKYLSHISLLHYKFSTECAGEKISKIGQYLAKIWTKVCGLFFGPPCRYEPFM